MLKLYSSDTGAGLPCTYTPRTKRSGTEGKNMNSEPEPKSVKSSPHVSEGEGGGGLLNI